MDNRANQYQYQQIPNQNIPYAPQNQYASDYAPPGYGAPAPNYGAPSPGYMAPAPGYGLNNQGYGVPSQPTYMPPQPVYPPHSPTHSQQTSSTRVVVVNSGGASNNQRPQQPVAVVVNPAVFHNNPNPVACKCSSCQRNIVTVVTTSTSVGQWLLCLLLFCFGCWFCCCIPFCVDSMQDGTHTCPSCGMVLGTMH